MSFSTRSFISIYLPFLLMLGVLLPEKLDAQQFTRITDSANPIAAETQAGPGGYAGGSWIDYDSDEDLDLFVNNTLLYRNDGGGVFVKITGSGIGSANNNNGAGHGNTWADVNNDGFIDCFIGAATSSLYLNNGDGTFTAVSSGDIGGGTANRGWACAFADIDDNSYVDLLIVHPANFVPGGPTPNHLFFNENGVDWTKVAPDSSDVTTGLAPYTVGTFSDFDLDGDQDLFIGSGPALGTAAPDNLYRNLLTETGTATLEKITTGILATDLVDGQVWNWVDYDNDGDLDAFLTNYAASVNNLYRNDAGTYVKMTAQDVGTLVSDVAFSLANNWADFDNDGDLDVYVTNDGGAASFYYANNGDGTFTRDTQIAIVGLNAAQCGASAGDYDRDGDLDLFVYSAAPGGRGLFRNDSETNGNAWVNIRAEGVQSNRSAIGARVQAKATMNGNPVWQMREISAQNSFSAQNSLNVHFGLADATVIDSLVITWPSDSVDVYTDVAIEQFYVATENQGLAGVTGIGDQASQLSKQFYLEQNWPNPFNPSTSIGFELLQGAKVDIAIYAVSGQLLRTLTKKNYAAGSYQLEWDGTDAAGNRAASGVYLYKMTATGLSGGTVQSASRKMILMK
ncbi:MAG: FG-GAP-like repeat-containing protein [Calditrichia bacterium]